MPEFDDLEDALRAAVSHLGGFKHIGPVLRPELPIDTAANWLRDCLNPDRREKLSPQQVLLVLKLARQAGHHAAAAFLMAECGYAEPVPVEPIDVAAKLQRQFIDAVAQLEHVQRELAKLQQPLPGSIRRAA